MIARNRSECGCSNDCVACTWTAAYNIVQRRVGGPFIDNGGHECILRLWEYVIADGFASRIPISQVESATPGVVAVFLVLVCLLSCGVSRKLLYHADT